MELKVGDKVLFVPRERRIGPPAWVTVFKVGHKWITLGTDGYRDRYRVAKGSSNVDGGQYTSPGTIWVSEEAYAEAVAIEKTWKAFRERLPYPAPKGITRLDIEKAAAVLGIELKAVAE
jgi:hypothetical protein